MNQQRSGRWINAAKRTAFVAGCLGMAAIGWLVLGQDDALARVAPGVHPIILPGLTYMGNASCAGSDCHSADKAKEQSGQNIGDESNIWAEGDPHAQAYKSLKADLSRQMGQKLNIADVAASERCLSCHAINAPAAQRGELFALEDAAGCESCHGPGQKWLNPHAEAGWTAKERQKLGPAKLIEQYGLVDTSNLAIRAHTCVACHLQIDKDLIDAGHPPLEFEMYAYNYYISKKPDKAFRVHWDEPTGKMQDARLWAVGQLAAHEAARAQTKAWRERNWDATGVESLEKLYAAGAQLVKKHFGADTAEQMTQAKLAPETAAAAAKDLAKLAPEAKDALQRRVVAYGVTALAAASYDGRGGEAPDAFWDAYDAAIAGAETGGGDYQAAVSKLAELAK